MVRPLVLILASISLTACAVYPDFQETCVGSENLRASTFGYRQFYVETVFPIDITPTRSEIVLHSPAVDNSVRSLLFSLDLKDTGSRTSLDLSGCRAYSTYRYSVIYDETDWDEFWSGSPSETFEFEYRFLEGPQKASARSFGLAFIDLEDGEPILSCGCYNF